MTDLFEHHGIIHQGVLSLSPAETFMLAARGVIIVDLRNTDYLAYKAFDLVNVISLPSEQFEEQSEKLDPDRYYVLADSSGIHSRLFAEKLRDRGFRHVAGMSGGFVEWERDGLPVRVNTNERLSGSCACQLKPRERGTPENKKTQ